MKNIIPKNNKLYIVLFCLLAMYSCDVINPEESIPAVIKIEEVRVEAIEDQEGSSLQEITDVWVFANPEGIEEGSELLGVFPIPATIPILEEGMTAINIQAGVKLNNQNANRSAYPFFRSEQQVVDLIPGETVKLKPVFSYKPPAQIRFDFINDFELSNDFFSISDSLQLELTSDKNLVFEGDRSLTLQLDTTNTSFAIASINNFLVQDDSEDIDEELPIGDREAYLEMHYKNDATLIVSMFLNENPIPLTLLRIGAKSEWSKIYIPLKDILVTANTNFDANVSTTIRQPIVKLAFEGFLPDSLSTARFSWDNIKIVHELN